MGIDTESASYTVLRVTEDQQIVLGARQVQRLGVGCEAALASFTRQASPGVYRAWWNGRALKTERLSGSRLAGDLTVRWQVSPYAHRAAPFAKPGPPSLYDSVRMPGTITLLTDASGAAILEADVAAVIAWDGHQLVLPPHQSPRVDSLALAEVAAAFPHRREPLLVAEPWPILLLNAAVGTCALERVDRPVFPQALRAELDARIFASRLAWAN